MESVERAARTEQATDTLVRGFIAVARWAWYEPTVARDAGRATPIGIRYSLFV